MKKKLLYKLIILIAAVGVAGFIFLSTVAASFIQTRIIREEAQSLYNEASSIAGDNSILTISRLDSLNSETEDSDVLYESLSKVALYQGCEIWLISTDGTIYLNTANSIRTAGSEKLEDFDPVALGSDYYSVGHFFDHFDDDHLSVMVPIASNLNIRGYVAVHMDMSDIVAERELVTAHVDLVCLIIYIAFILIFAFFYRTVMHPMRQIIEGTRHYAKGDLKYNIPVKSNDEMGELASSLNYMSDELNKSGEYQKQFIANISHDFRSPLTSIRGFVEAMLDGTIPPEAQEHYLKIVLSETERLTKLTNGILTLNSMDQNKNMLNITRFDINSVIRDTAATFEGICRPRQISIRLSLTGDVLYVSADKEKIQQVIYNLVDNAIKFSRDNSSVEIRSDIRHDKVFISVHDHGVGIPRGSINKIWERFYKTDASRGREKKGNGLGLAIVKEIINQHGQNITVISTEGVGTEFVFSLDAAEDS